MKTTFKVTYTYIDGDNRVIAQDMGQYKAVTDKQAISMALERKITDPDQRALMRPNVVATEVTEKAMAV